MLGRQPKLIATMKKLFLIVAAMFAAVSFSACSDDDDNKDASIVGTWQITLDEGWETFNSSTPRHWSEPYPSDGYYYTYTFDGKGSCISNMYTNGREDEDSPIHYTYSISGNTLIMNEQSNDPIKYVYEIKKLTNSELILFIHEEEWFEAENRTGEYEQTETFKRL